MLASCSEEDNLYDIPEVLLLLLQRMMMMLMLLMLLKNIAAVQLADNATG